MTTDRLPEVTLTNKHCTADPVNFKRRPDNSLFSQRVMVDCEKGGQPITVSFFQYRGYHCSIWIKYGDYSLIGHDKGSTPYNALIATLKAMGITFNSDIPISMEAVDFVMNSIADAIGIGKKREITHACVKGILPLL